MSKFSMEFVNSLVEAFKRNNIFLYNYGALNFNDVGAQFAVTIDSTSYVVINIFHDNTCHFIWNYEELIFLNADVFGGKTTVFPVRHNKKHKLISCFTTFKDADEVYKYYTEFLHSIKPVCEKISQPETNRDSILYDVQDIMKSCENLLKTVNSTDV